MPDLILNPFESDAFNMIAMTRNINKFPNQYSRLQQMGLFSEEGVPTRSVMLEWYEGVINLLTSQPEGAPGALNVSGKRKVASLTIPHYPLDDVVKPAEYAGVREFGSSNQLQTAATVMARKLMGMKNKHDITKEWLMMGALKGIIYDGDMATVLANLYGTFRVQQKTVWFDLDTSTTDVEGKCEEVTTWIREHLYGEMMTGVHSMVSRTFMRKLKSHDFVLAFRERNPRSQDALLSAEDRSRFFEFGGIMFEQYDAKAPTTAGGSNNDFISAGEGHAFPLGTMDTFKLYNAPADFNETVNTLGLPYYAKQEPRKFNRGTDVHTQSNPLPMCRRPEVLVKLDDGAAPASGE